MEHKGFIIQRSQNLPTSWNLEVTFHCYSIKWTQHMSHWIVYHKIQNLFLDSRRERERCDREDGFASEENFYDVRGGDITLPGHMPCLPCLFFKDINIL